tara:strand:- start:506 stop:730 length:225 start_codon:yes stop_codon:yes gene_type:complete
MKPTIAHGLWDARDSYYYSQVSGDGFALRYACEEDAATVHARLTEHHTFADVRSAMASFVFEYALLEYRGFSQQ